MPHMANDPEVRVAPTKVERAHKWQWLAAVPGLLLASGFAMPMAYSKSGPINPCRSVAEMISALRAYSVSGYEPMALFGAFLTGFVAPYAIGLAAGSAGIARRCGRPRLMSLCSGAIFAVLTLYCGVALSYVIAYVFQYGPRAVVGYSGVPLIEFAILGFLGVIPALTLGHLLASLRSGSAASACRAFLGSLLTVLWFGTLVLLLEIGPGVPYGAWISLASSLMLLIATIGEATVAGGRSWPRTLWQLVTCRLSIVDERSGSCPGCGYNLYGLNERRCPECGRAFTFEEIGATPQELAFAGPPSGPST
jgi:hypothetical protein